MTRDELVNALIDWDLGPCSEAASMLQRDVEAIAALEAERDRLKAALSKSEQTAERWRADCMYFWSMS